MNETLRICAECGKKQPLDYFLPTSNKSLYNKNGSSYICVECIAKKIDKTDLSSIDKMCQFLDLPFDANKWIEMSKTYEKLGPLLIDYCQELNNDRYAESDWYQYNQMWEKCREYNSVIDKLTAIHDDLLVYLMKKWGKVENFTLDEYLRMEEYERHTLSHYPFKDEARRDMVRKLAKLSAIADHCMMSGDNKEATTVLQSYNTLMKELGISTETSNEADSIDTLSELVAYLEKTGFLLNYKISENRDIVDKTITNYEQYVKRLFMDSNETVQEMYNSAKLQEEGGTEITDDDIDNLYQLEAEEADIDLGAPMDEKDLKTMFTQLENEYK